MIPPFVIVYLAIAVVLAYMAFMAVARFAEDLGRFDGELGEVWGEIETLKGVAT